MNRKIKQAEVVSSYETEEEESLQQDSFSRAKTEESASHEATPRTMAGCLRGIIAASASVVVAAIGGIGVGIHSGLIMGFLTGFALLIVLLSVSVYLMNNAKNLTIADCLLPLPIGIISAIVFTPVSLILGGSFFSAVTCLGASFLLTLMLLLYRAKKIHGGWLIIPFLVFLYEILPVELPTDLDNFLSLGGDGINLVGALLFRPNADTDLLE